MITLPYEIHYGTYADDWNGISGSNYNFNTAYLERDAKFEIITKGLDLSTVVCDYCGGTYLAELVKSLKITNCLGCGSAKFHFDRR